MIRGIVLGCCLAGAVVAASAQAQDRSDEARLDDFALPETQRAQSVEQLNSGDTARLPAQRVDLPWRILAKPMPRARCLRSFHRPVPAAP